MGIEDHISTFAEQGATTIFGLTRLVESANKLLKLGEITDEQYFMLLGATFSRHLSVELIFGAFRSPVYHDLVVNDKAKAQVGKGIIFHCIHDLTQNNYLVVSRVGHLTTARKMQKQVLILCCIMKYCFSYYRPPFYLPCLSYVHLVFDLILI